MASLVKTGLDHEYIIGTEVEMTPDQAIKWFAEINLGIEFYSNADNKLLLKYSVLSVSVMNQFQGGLARMMKNQQKFTWVTCNYYKWSSFDL